MQNAGCKQMESRIGRKPRQGTKRERILRVLANNPEGKMSIRAMSKETETSRSWVKKLILQLEARNLVERTRVVSFRRLLDYWREVSIRPLRRSYTIKNPMYVLRDANLRYALTTYAGENLVQGHLFPSRVEVHINPRDQEKWHTYLSKTGLVGRGNLRTLASDSHVFYNAGSQKGHPVVSIPQLVVDLLNEGGVCTEAAYMLMEKMTNRVS
jgi:DNA-binding Lrp family transcriptional regulator